MLSGRCHCGKAGWTYDADPRSATACNCSMCSRHGALWAYGAEGQVIALTGHTTAYTRADLDTPALAFHFCAGCGCLVCWRAVETDKTGVRTMAVNLRLAEPDRVKALPVRHFDGLDAWRSRPDDGRTVGDLWF